MTDILSHYYVNNYTMALIPAYHFDYKTIVMEYGKQLFIKQSPFNLIQEACLAGGSSYEGRRTAVIYQTDAKRKVPIPIYPSNNIYTFPTESPKEFSCNWIFYNHILSIKPHHSARDPRVKSIITFQDGQQLTSNQSHYQLEKQRQRTAFCITQFTSVLKHLLFI